MNDILASPELTARQMHQRDLFLIEILITSLMNITCNLALILFC